MSTRSLSFKAGASCANCTVTSTSGSPNAPTGSVPHEEPDRHGQSKEEPDRHSQCKQKQAQCLPLGEGHSTTTAIMLCIVEGPKPDAIFAECRNSC